MIKANLEQAYNLNYFWKVSLRGRQIIFLILKQVVLYRIMQCRPEILPKTLTRLYFLWWGIFFYFVVMGFLVTLVFRLKTLIIPFISCISCIRFLS